MRPSVFECGLVGEEDVLGGQLVADVVLGEVAAPRQQDAGGDEHGADDDTGGDQEGVDGAPAHGHGRGGLRGAALAPLVGTARPVECSVIGEPRSRW